jgi:DNA-binding PadR family transcriptional regulator
MNYFMDRPRRAPRTRRHWHLRRTLWSLAVLAMLREQSMHPYEMQRVMHQRHTDELLALKRGSLYHAINQLQRDGLIEPIQTSREGRRPERTVYQITPDGEEELGVWMRELLSVPVHEPSQFSAALAFLVHIPPEAALEQLELRAVGLEAGIAAMRAVERGIAAWIGRLSILELEYQRVLLEAELTWVRSLIDDLRSHKVTWNFEEMKRLIGNSQANINNIEEDAT